MLGVIYEDRIWILIEVEKDLFKEIQKLEPCRLVRIVRGARSRWVQICELELIAFSKN